MPSQLAQPVPRARCGWCAAAAAPGGSRLLECAACGCATTYPPPDAAELEVAYAGWYRPASGRFAAGGDTLLRRSRATLARRLHRRAPPGPVLDVGCGDGVLLDALGLRGRDALGLERETRRGDVRACEITDLKEGDGTWAAVVFWHSLEHLAAPAAALDRARDLLRPGGLLVLAVPNRASRQAQRFGERWFALDLPRHLVHFSAGALLDGLEQRGLEVERVSYWRGGQVVFGWLHGLVGTLPGHPNLYAAIRRPQARVGEVGPALRGTTLLAGALLAPVALACAAAEVRAGAGGTVYIEARKR